jgi:hypothetical protein
VVLNWRNRAVLNEEILHDAQFSNDIGPLLAPGFEWDTARAAARVHSQLIERLAGDPWQGDGNKWLSRR